MAFAFLTEKNFELGGVTEWTSETDTNGKLNVRHYSDSAMWGQKLTPYRGAYAAHIDLRGGTADAFLQEDTAFDTAAAATIHIAFAFYASDLVMATTNRFNIFALESAAGTNEAAISVLYTTAGGYELVASETGATAIGAGSRGTILTQGVWHWIELSCVIDAGGGNDGTITFYVDGWPVGTAIATLDQGAIVHARLGVTGVDAGTTAGHLVFDSVYADDGRIQMPYNRFHKTRTITKSGHLFVGPGTLADAALLSTGADTTCILWDTDVAGVGSGQEFVRELGATASPAVEGPIPFQRGCYVQLGGTAPRAQATISEAPFYSDWGYKHYGSKRQARGNNT